MLTMKHTLYHALLATAITLISGCDIIETSSSGKLTGQWQILTIDTLSTGGQLQMKEDRKYFSIEDRLFYIHDADEAKVFFADYVYADDQLTLSNFTIYTQGSSDEPLVTDITDLQPYGINALTETFTITLTSSRMVLQNDTLRITLRNF